MKTSLLLLGTAVALLTGAASSVHAQQLITSLHTAYTQDFDTFDGTEETLPDHFVFTPSVPGLSYNGYYDRSAAHVNLNRVYALRDTPLSTDIAFGLKHTASGSSRLDWTFVNDTGGPISSFVIGWDFEQYSEAGRASRISLRYAIGEGSFTTTGLSGDLEMAASHRPVGASPGVINLAAIAVTPMQAELQLSAPLAAGQSITFSWAFVTGSVLGSSDNNAHVGIDNLSITAVPEPSSLALLAGTALAGGGVLLHRRRKGGKP